MNDRTITIGQLALRTGVSVRTIRFWTDSGVIPEPARSRTGYRLYDTEALARVDLVKTLRELGFDLETVKRVLNRQANVADVVKAHVKALDGEIRALTLRRAFLRAVVTKSGTAEEMRLMHKLAKLSAVERQRIMDEFVGEVFAGVDPNPMTEGIVKAMRGLPDDPAPDKVDAWIELAELVADDGFRARVRQMATAEDPGLPPFDHAAVMELAGGALSDGISPQSEAGQAILAQLLETPLSTAEKREIADKLETFTDRRVERYWQLLGILNDRPPFGGAVAPFEWMIAALRGSLSS
jgi:DNA-binding transcriptional MerR regulator